jgi:hypothetical protein
VEKHVVFGKVWEASHDHVTFDAEARVEKHCVFAGFGKPPMTMLHFRSVDSCDWRGTCAQSMRM